MISNIWISFIAGLYAPLLAVCVLPMYPAFLAYLSGQTKGRTKAIVFGLIATGGIIASMMLIGFIFVKLLASSLTQATGMISPVAFSILAIISIAMIFGFDLSRIIPKKNAPILKNPYLSSFVFGFFFGAIVLPCNPASLLVLFSFSTTAADVTVAFLGFIAFGIGMAAPLLVLSAVSDSGKVINFLTEHKRVINQIAGVLMLGISLYYLVFVFAVFG